MVVEDEAIVALDIQKRLVAFGYRVVARVTTAEDALRKARETEPDLILMDIKIRGGLDGIETAAAIRSRQDIPIIYLTAFADEPTLARARLTEAYGYLLKPIEDRALRSAIEIALSKHRAERKLRESEERYALIARATNDGIWDWDLTTDTIYYSPRLKALLGLPEAYQLPTPRDLIDRIHPDDSARLDQAIADHLLGMTAFLNGEYRIRHQDGTYHWMMCRGLAIFDAQHKPYRFAGSLSDVTEEKINIENEKQRRKEAELLRQLTFAISSSLNLREVLDHILTGLAKAVPFDSAVITLIEDNYLKIVAQGGALRHTRHIEEKIGKSDGLFSLLESSLVPVVLGDAQTHPKYEQWSADGKDPIHGWMGIPLIAYERPIGYLMLNNQDRDIYNADHARLAQAFANQAAVAI
jgi:PAS domain S-box-containing protein